MQEDRNRRATIRETSKFDDEITLPLRIICEKARDVRERERGHKEVHKLVCAS